MIPKKIHYCWFGNNEIPEKDRRNIEGWGKINPEYEIIRWDESNYDLQKNNYMKEAYEAKKWGFVPDYARLDIIYNEGGIYLDTDVEILKPLDELLGYTCFAGLESEGRVALGLGFGAEKGSSVIKTLLDYYNDKHFIKEDGSYDLRSAPEIQMGIFKELGLTQNNEIQILNGITVFPTDYFCPMNYMTGIISTTCNTFTIHHYNMSWMNKRELEIVQLTRKYSKMLGIYLGRNIAEVVVYLKEDGLLKTVHYIFCKFQRKFTSK